MQRLSTFLAVFAVVACRANAPVETTPVEPSGTADHARTAPRDRGPSCVKSSPDADDPRFVRGYVDVVDATGASARIYDACEDDHYVREGRCPDEATTLDAQLGYYVLAYCEHGCRDGACHP